MSFPTANPLEDNTSPFDFDFQDLSLDSIQPSPSISLPQQPLEHIPSSTDQSLCRSPESPVEIVHPSPPTPSLLSVTISRDKCQENYRGLRHFPCQDSIVRSAAGWMNLHLYSSSEIVEAAVQVRDSDNSLVSDCIELKKVPHPRETVPLIQVTPTTFELKEFHFLKTNANHFKTVRGARRSVGIPGYFVLELTVNFTNGQQGSWPLVRFVCVSKPSPTMEKQVDFQQDCFYTNTLFTYPDPESRTHPQPSRNCRNSFIVQYQLLFLPYHETVLQTDVSAAVADESVNDDHVDSLFCVDQASSNSPWMSSMDEIQPMSEESFLSSPSAESFLSYPSAESDQTTDHYLNN